MAGIGGVRPGMYYESQVSKDEESPYAKAESFHQMIDTYRIRMVEKSEILAPFARRNYLSFLNDQVAFLTEKKNVYFDIRPELKKDFAAYIFELEPVIYGHDISKFKLDCDAFMNQFDKVDQSITNTTIDFSKFSFIDGAAGATGGVIIGNGIVDDIAVKAAASEVRMQLGEVGNAYHDLNRALGRVNRAWAKKIGNPNSFSPAKYDKLALKYKAAYSSVEQISSDVERMVLSSRTVGFAARATRVAQCAAIGGAAGGVAGLAIGVGLEVAAEGIALIIDKALSTQDIKQ